MPTVSWSRLALVAVPLALALALLAPSGLGLGATEAFACANSGKNPRNVKTKQAQRAVICLVNKRRANHNLTRLRFRTPLRNAARSHSKRMRNRGCFGHNCGGSLRQRLSRTRYLSCNCAFAIGETLAWGAGQRGSPRRIVRSWMRSGAHRGILLAPNFRHIGVGMVRGSPNRPNRLNHGTFTAILGVKV